MPSSEPTLRDLVDLLHGWYPPASAESWDAVGLVLGDPDARVSKVMFAVDPTEAVAREAAAWGADLLVVHHPLFLKAVHGVPATTPKGRTLATLAKAGCGLLTAHTNADQAEGGVSEALAHALGLSDLRPILPAPAAALDKLTVFVPVDAAQVVRAALAEAGAGRIGDYDHASFSTPGQGRFRPLAGAQPSIGAVGVPEVVAEERVEVVLERHLRARVVTALLRAHPYEEPAYDVVELADPQIAATGTGRIGTVERTTLGEFAQAIAAALPATAHGVRVAGDPDRAVRRVALCGGSGDFLLDTVAGTDADVYVTSDLRHHPASEFVEKGGPALVDVAHWAAEWTWLPVVEARVKQARGDTVETRVSTTCTDPWTFRPSHPEAPGAPR
ncbi:Nif3-like dinuclear metal center hexameric protein [Nocardioides sp. dk4132]|uniref:Nif3-like dinuclear metal center hexameric protein n=1 Tax=unclassified Nocardioides TaxID=2615069 RepID=UPI00129738AC|nr:MULTISPECIES: Nif3-like dinuclear metal center hexameric protein [unclassified Nocardioides]MQW77873.1 Nif3-like dinuclear metal center hexameric protein [Nocardioides sp. dk4132]QGA08261.1 Nif3-like dinuclear metal center hexameric protein [Nocardioides sp. dk884]